MRGLGLLPAVVRAWRRLFSCKDSREVLPTFPSSAPSHFPPRPPVASLSVLPFVHFQLISHEPVLAKPSRDTGLAQASPPEPQQCHACGNATGNATIPLETTWE